MKRSAAPASSSCRGARPAHGRSRDRHRDWRDESVACCQCDRPPPAPRRGPAADAGPRPPGRWPTVIAPCAAATQSPAEGPIFSPSAPKAWRIAAPRSPSRSAASASAADRLTGASRNNARIKSAGSLAIGNEHRSRYRATSSRGSIQPPECVGAESRGAASARATRLASPKTNAEINAFKAHDRSNGGGAGTWPVSQPWTTTANGAADSSTCCAVRPVAVAVGSRAARSACRSRSGAGRTGERSRQHIDRRPRFAPGSRPGGNTARSECRGRQWARAGDSDQAAGSWCRQRSGQEDPSIAAQGGHRLGYSGKARQPLVDRSGASEQLLRILNG